jgi:hypothetical protein
MAKETRDALEIYSGAVTEDMVKVITENLNSKLAPEDGQWTALTG